MVANKRLSLLITTSTLGLLIVSLSGCQTIKIGQGKASPGQTNQTSTASTDVSGPWQISFEVNKVPMSAHINLQQSGNSFQGTGTDDKDSQNFVIDSGVINGKSLRFHKRYNVEENPNLPPIVYTGVFDVVSTPEYSGPYISGNYTATKNGQPTISGVWDGRKEGAEASPAPVQQTSEPQPQQASNKHPHLSGKWDAGYEFEFKTVHSSMYIEQDNQKISGHGIDKNSKETFTLTGKYTYPDIRFVLKYNPTKDKKGKLKPERKLEFRGNVTVVNEPDYNGPRLEGKTNGGGAWMAEIVK